MDAEGGAWRATGACCGRGHTCYRCLPARNTWPCKEAAQVTRGQGEEDRGIPKPRADETAPDN